MSTTAAPAAPARPARRAPGPVALLALTVAAGLVAVLVGLVLSGAADAPELVDPGALVRWGLPAVTTLSELAAALTVGALVLAVGVLPRRPAVGDGSRRGPGSSVVDGTAWPAAGVLAAGAAGAWTVLALVGLVLRYAQVAGQAPFDPGFGAQLGVYVTQIELGRTTLSVVALAAVVTVLALLVQTPTGAAWTSLVALAALWQQAQTGHSAAAASHELAVSSMFLHLVGAAIWVGALLALAVLRPRLGDDVAPAVSRFSVVAGWCLVLVAVSGTVNGALRTGLDGLTTPWGLLLLAKVGLLAVLGLLGLAHRRRVVGRLAAGPGVGTVRGLLWRLVAVELAVMGAVSGVAVALGSTAPPVPDDAPTDPTPAEVLTGAPLPPEPTALRWLTEWRWDLLAATAAVSGAVVYVRWVRRLRARGDRWPVLRTVSFLTGMAVFFWTTSGGPAAYGKVLFSAHMLEHMVLVMVVPVLVALSAPVTLALRALPVRAARTPGDASRGPREWILVLVHSRVGSFLAHPVVAAVNFVGSMIAFYYTDAFRWALESHVGHVAMILHFSVAGYLFVNAMVGLDPGPTRLGFPQRLLLLFSTMAFHAFFGVALVSGRSLLVADWFGLMGRPWGASALADQQAGGAITWGIGELPTLALAVGLVFAWARDDERVARRRDRTVARTGDTELEDYNAMLARLSSRSGGDAGR
ncbi:copper resistance protein D [Cellulomonas marina]|uniref:Putative copper resistance protein D n=1 Tax=Cellulomonas marina TaxID=988821 RepID=A0A1I0YEC1_9CELL|nr:copper resistance protein D [Cellulomonas marina]SFB11571.1 putative copper resistance protein D [Cellulomonas marina]